MESQTINFTLERETKNTAPVKQRARDLAATDDLERRAATQYLETGDVQWWDRVMKALERRAKMLGLDHKEPPPGSTPDKPLHVSAAPGQIDWDNLPDDLAEEFLAVHAKIVALQPSSGGFIIEGEVAN